MTVEELKSIYLLQQSIISDRDKIRALRSNLDGIESIKYNEPKVTGGPTNNYRVENLIIEVSRLEKRLKKKQEKQTALIHRAEKIIARIEDEDLRDILIYRYLYFLKWTRIQAILCTSRSNLFRRHRKALDYFKKKGTL